MKRAYTEKNTRSSSTSSIAGKNGPHPKTRQARSTHNKAKTGDDLRDFVNGKLFPHLHGFKQKASGPNTIEYKIGEIFGEIKNKI
jgi:type I restriction enzyme M protein